MSRGQRGFALLAALWILVAVGALAATFQAAARADRAAVANARAASRARWAARAGLAFAVRALDSALSGSALPYALLGAGDTVMTPIALRLNGVRAQAVARDGRARINLNDAGAPELRVLFGAVGFGPVEAERLADAVLDWRDPDDTPRPAGAEGMDYAARHVPWRPANGPFAGVEELGRVLGVDPAVYRRAAPYLTVAGDGRVNVNAAAVPVLRTLPAIDSAAAEAVARRRRSAPFANLYELVVALPPVAQQRVSQHLGELEGRVAFTPRELEIEVTTEPEGSPVRLRLVAVVRLTGGAGWNLLRVTEP